MIPGPVGTIRPVPNGDFTVQPMFYSPQLADIQERLGEIEAAILGLATVTAEGLDRLTGRIDALAVSQGELMTDLTALDDAVSGMEAQVSENTDVTASASALLDQLAQIIRDNATDPAALAALADRITSASGAEASSNAALAAAVSANTPATPAP